MSTPEEYFTGKKPVISHLNIFSSSVYIHVTKDARKKLELTTEFGIFVGYTETPHNYCVYFPNSWMTVVCWDIKFNEVKAMKLSLERELHLHVEEELIVPKDEPQDVDQRQEEDHGVEESTHTEPNIKIGKRHTTEAERMKLNVA